MQITIFLNQTGKEVFRFYFLLSAAGFLDLKQLLLKIFVDKPLSFRVTNNVQGVQLSFLAFVRIELNVQRTLHIVSLKRMKNRVFLMHRIDFYALKLILKALLRL